MHAFARSGLAVALLSMLTAPAGADGDAKDGAMAFRACAACHSLVPGRHMTGPSLAGIWERTAGTADGFPRYSDALKSSGVTWSAETLDAWLADPQNPDLSLFDFGSFSIDDVRSDVGISLLVTEGLLRVDFAKRTDRGYDDWRVTFRILDKF